MMEAGPDTDRLTRTRRRNVLASLSCLLLLFLLLLACAEPVFPPAVLKGVDFTSEFELSTSEVDTHMEGRIVLIGGRMVAIQQESGRLQIMADELRFEKDPLSGRLVETGRPLGTIAVDYPANIEHLALERGNKFLAIGRVQGTTKVTIEGMLRVIHSSVRDACTSGAPAGTRSGSIRICRPDTIRFVMTSTVSRHHHDSRLYLTSIARLS